MHDGCIRGTCLSSPGSCLYNVIALLFLGWPFVLLIVPRRYRPGTSRRPSHCEFSGFFPTISSFSSSSLDQRRIVELAAPLPHIRVSRRVRKVNLFRLAARSRVRVLLYTKPDRLRMRSVGVVWGRKEPLRSVKWPMDGFCTFAASVGPITLNFV